MERVLVSLNWTFGTLFLLLALLYPALDDKFLTGSKKVVAQQTVARIAQLETRHYQVNEQYIVFSAEDMPEAIRSELGLKGPLQDDFSYDAFMADNGQLVIRAQVSPANVRSASMPPWTYTLRQGAGDRSGEGRWETLSGKKPGLF